MSTTGIAGFTLGGGIGWLVRKHGLTCDNLRAVEFVTADGRQVRASKDERPDLFWGVRGGGGNFGVATAFEYDLHPIGRMLGGLVLHPRQRAAEALRFFRDFTATAPDELTCMLVLLTAPPLPFVPAALQEKPAVAVAACYAGDLERGEQAIKPLRQFGPPAADMLGPMPYPALQRMFDDSAPKGMRNYWKSAYLADLPDSAIETIVDHAARMGGPLAQVHLHLLGGAVSRVPADATAYVHRDAPFVVNLVGMWADASDDDASRGWKI